MPSEFRRRDEHSQRIHQQAHASSDATRLQTLRFACTIRAPIFGTPISESTTQSKGQGQFVSQPFELPSESPLEKVLEPEITYHSLSCAFKNTFYPVRSSTGLHPGAACGRTASANVHQLRTSGSLIKDYIVNSASFSLLAKPVPSTRSNKFACVCMNHPSTPTHQHYQTHCKTQLS